MSTTTTTTPTSTTTPTLADALTSGPLARTVALGICALLGLADIAGTAGIGADDAPPAFVVLVGTALGIITLAAALPAVRGRTPGLLTVLGSRFVSAALGFGVYFDDGAPRWAEIAVAVFVCLTLAAFGLLATAAQAPARGTRP
ncbi:hypothetical protein [Streptomyces cylindrosporus]|uniref:Integral membrane protein n=1 Tax=Streptomyces cylindrosporus TaxID=2927583 RepID=A0ABS9YNR4_9ACTN|nr:hypothetical protein [Streptomyces cylindrosporus]MCI3278902.1 hypothetical protein [Streptomyces cylindrosporus]